MSYFKDLDNDLRKGFMSVILKGTLNVVNPDIL